MERMVDPAQILRAALDWWRAAGVDSPEAEAILAAGARPPNSPDAAPTQNNPAQPTPAIAPRRPPKRVDRNPSDDARAAAAAAQDLKALAGAIAAFEGCGLKQTARNTVFSDGVIGAPIMLIGEAPGKDEDLSGKPFVGRSGQLLDRMLATIGVSRAENLFITNVIFWRPPGNRPPTQGEIATCLPFVERAIVLARPKLLILAGGVPAQAILRRSEGVMRLRGKRFDYGSPELTQPLSAMVMLHPAYLLRRPQEKRLAWTDLLAFESLAKEQGVGLSPAF